MTNKKHLAAIITCLKKRLSRSCPVSLPYLSRTFKGTGQVRELSRINGGASPGGDKDGFINQDNYLGIPYK